MGVGGNFWELAKPYARNEGFDFLRNKRVAVDLSFWIVQHGNAIKAHVRKPHLRLTFFRTINLFSKFGALPVFVVDGTPSPLKSQARIARYFRSSGIELTSLPVPEEGVSAERNPLFSSCVQECVELVELLGMPVLKAKGEAEALCAQLNSEGHVDACITADSDAFLFGAKCIIKCFCPNSKEPFECYNMSDIEAGLGLKRKHLIAISLLVGNDYDMNGVRGIGLDTALRFVKAFSEDDILNRLHEIGKGNTSQIPTSIKFEDNMDMDENSPNRKQPHCSFCGHPGNKKGHMKFSCEYCITKDDEGCQRKPEAFTCDCFSCGMKRRHKEQKRLANWHTKFCHKIAEEPGFPKDEIIYMYLCNDNGYFSASDGPPIIWRKPNIEMLIDFLNFHQHWEPSYIRRTMVPMMSTIFLRDMATTKEETLLFGQYEFDSINRVKMRYGYQFYVVKWKRAGGNIAYKVPSKESSVQQDAIELDETVDLLDGCDEPEIREDDGCCFLFTDENMDLVEAAFPAELERFRQEQELKRRKNSTSISQENKISATPNSKSIQLNITEFYTSTKVKHRQSKQRGESSKNSDAQGSGTPKMKRKTSSPTKLSKSVRRRLLFDNLEMSINQVPVKRKKAEWYDKNVEVFLKVCIEEVHAGNKPHIHFNKIGWANIAEKFNKATKLTYQYKQFKNKWDALKKEWQLWTKLIGKDTGLGWDAEKKTIDASDEWWEAKIQENPEVAKFREQGLKFLTEMEFLFKGTVTTGFAAYAPSEDLRQSERLNIGIEETQDNIDNETEMEVNETEIEMTTQTTSSAKESGHRKRERNGDKRIGATAKLSAQSDRVIQNFKSSSGESAEDPTSITTCIAKLKVLPGLMRGSDIFFKATRLMKKRANRITFVALEDPELQLGWINSHT